MTPWKQSQIQSSPYPWEIHSKIPSRCLNPTYCVASYTYILIWRAPRIFPGGFPRTPKWLGLNAAGARADPESAQVCDRGDTGRVRTQGGKHCSGPMSKWVCVYMHVSLYVCVHTHVCVCTHVNVSVCV